jgi:hypothetical protein
MAKKTFEVALLLTAKDEATRIMANAAARQRQILAMSERGDRAFGAGRNAGMAGAAIIAPLMLTVKAAQDSEEATKRLALAYKLAGDADGKRAEKAAEYASALQMRIGIEDEDIMLTQAKLASFHALTTSSADTIDAFNRTTEAAHDMAAGGFGDAIGNANALGKALQNPALGAMALGKSGALNKADIPLIKQIQATKGLTAAQDYLLKALEKQYKGQAANLMTPAKRTQMELAELSETIGKTILPMFNRLMKRASDAAASFQKWATENKPLLSTITNLAAKTGLFLIAVSGLSFVFGGVFKAISIGMSIMNGYRTLMITVTAVQNAMAFSAMAGGTSIQVLSAALKAANLAFLTSPIFLVITAIAVAAYFIIKNWTPIKEFFAKLWTGIKQVFWKAVDFMKEWGILFLGPIGWVIKAYQLLPNKFKNIGTDIVMGLWNGIKSKAMALFDFVKGIGKGIANAFKTVLGIASPSKVFMDYGVNITEGAHNGIKKGESKLVGASKGMGSSIKPTVSGRGNGGNSSVTVNFAPVINGGSGDVATQVKALIPELIRQIESQMQRKQRLAY